MKKLKEKINIRNSIIGILLVTIIILVIGFIVLSMNMKQEVPKFNVSFVSVTQISSVKGGTTEPTTEYKITNDNMKVNFKLTMNSPYDELAYTIKIKNKGNMTAKIVDIVDTPDYMNNAVDLNSISPVKIFHNDLTDTIIEPGETKELNIVANYGSGTPEKKTINYTVSLVTTSINNK